jgi:group I intron endonuclease
MRITIYEIQNKINSKIYIGQTRMNLRQRVQAHIDNAKRKNITIIGLALLKYGRENFKIIPLEYYDNQEDADKKERELIRANNSFSPNGYNIREGGSRGAIAEETKEKLRKYIRTSDTRKRMSQSAKGKISTIKQLEALTKGRIIRNKLHYRGENNANAKLTNKEILEIKCLYQTNEYSEEELGRKFGVKQVTISAIITGKNWKFLFPDEY